MNPWDILAWVAALSVSAVVVALALSIVVNTVRSLRKPKPVAPINRSTRVMGGER